MIADQTTEFAGRAVVQWEPGEPIVSPELNAFRISVDWDEFEAGTTWSEKFGQFLNTPGAENVGVILVGPWEEVCTGTDSTEIAEALAAASGRLISVTGLFIGDIVGEESEISWIQHGDLSALLNAYPTLEYLTIRGGTGLSLGVPHLPNLRSLVIESGGLPVNVVREVTAATLPSLEHMEIWLGTDYYGADATVEDVAALINSKNFPRLTYLGLRDSEIADGIAAAIAEAPILDQLHTLDLSLGTLGDEGATALVVSSKITKLKKLDIHHNFCTDVVIARLKQLPIEVEAGSRQDEARYGRYVSVAE